MLKRLCHAAFVLLVSPAAFAQTEAAAGVAPAEQAEGEGDGRSGGKALEERLRALEEENARQSEENARQAAKIEALEQRADAAEESQMAEIEEASASFVPTFHVYGFMDLTLSKWFTKDESMWVAAYQNNLSFMFTGVNLYMQSRITETISALVELKFTFLPLGAETEIVPSYERVDTHINDPSTKKSVAVGGIIIERAQMTWQPIDAFGVTAGRYLTPYGIWNIDHGSPVVLPATLPYMILRDTIQGAQTGLQIHGRFLPRESLILDYAVTLSNGRGPTEEIYDLDNHKAVGLRLKLAYERKDVRVGLGGYGYVGKMTDIVKEYAAIGTSDFKVTDTESYYEYSGAADLLVELYGVRLQSEFAGGYIKYEVRPVRIIPFIYLASPDGQKQPDYLRWDYYALLAWELPLRELLGDMTLTPWAMFEYSMADDSYPDFNVVSWRAGLDFKPNAAVVLKLDCAGAYLPDTKYDVKPGYLAEAQLAVAF